MKINKQSRNNGLFLGIILVTFTLILSMANPTGFLKTKSFVLIVPFFIILMKNCFDFRKRNDGIADIKSLFIQGMICSSIAIFICTGFEFLLFNYLFPELNDIYKNVSLEALEESAGIFGESFIEKNREAIENQELYGISQTITLLITRMLAPGALLSFLTALIFKKNKSTNL